MNHHDPIAAFLDSQPHYQHNVAPEKVLAMNVLWRDGMTLAAIARLFGVSRNTLYYKIATGHARSYPKGPANCAAAVNDLVEAVGVDEIRRRFVTPAMVKRRAAA